VLELKELQTKEEARLNIKFSRRAIRQHIDLKMQQSPPNTRFDSWEVAPCDHQGVKAFIKKEKQVVSTYVL